MLRRITFSAVFALGLLAAMSAPSTAEARPIGRAHGHYHGFAAPAHRNFYPGWYWNQPSYRFGGWRHFHR